MKKLIIAAFAVAFAAATQAASVAWGGYVANDARGDETAQAGTVFNAIFIGSNDYSSQLSTLIYDTATGLVGTGTGADFKALAGRRKSSLDAEPSAENIAETEYLLQESYAVIVELSLEPKCGAPIYRSTAKSFSNVMTSSSAEKTNAPPHTSPKRWSRKSSWKPSTSCLIPRMKLLLTAK